MFVFVVGTSWCSLFKISGGTGKSTLENCLGVVISIIWWARCQRSVTEKGTLFLQHDIDASSASEWRMEYASCHISHIYNDCTVITLPGHTHRVYGRAGKIYLYNFI